MMQTQDPVSFLAERWDAMMASVQAESRNSTLCFGDIVALYSRGRAYHTLDHLVALMTQAENLTFDDPVSVRLAIFYHDAVYGPVSRMLLNLPEGQSNEEQSALLAENHLTMLGFDRKTVARVMDLIRMTQTHAADPADHDAALFLDMDMSILGCAPQEYDRYAVQVRAEYAAVDAAAYIAGRTAFLDRTLARRFFITEHYEQQYGQQARENMRREKAMLQALSGPRADPAP